ncbi:uroporphyrinogen-III synthase [Rhodobacter sp. KR11]|uniref:uroporphyrinogen-III synthase n=1 Tax=Rhodobacter sp. KR11 TaxID=2974588 RepID=UPI002223E06A|nr:uroporphyrinogen-III synthase [Rhodobacter sp. KR11]MCW1918968.1 uroporphyrinogen-III synthase [Rhodobacter sp. KR11]
MSAQPRPLILLTRPEAQSQRFARDLGLPCLISPLIAPRFLHPEIPAHRALILTSETGALAARGLPPCRAYCVGDQTAATARALGFDAVSAQGDAKALIALILTDPVAPLLHLRGCEARGDIAARLTAAGLPTAEALAYAQEERPLTAEAIAALRGTAPVLVPLFSPRSATLLAAELARIGATAPLRVVAMSQAVAEAARALDSRALDPEPRIAARPDALSMREATRSALNLPPLP